MNNYALIILLTRCQGQAGGTHTDGLSQFFLVQTKSRRPINPKKGIAFDN
jgi:hypothetical protein